MGGRQGGHNRRKAWRGVSGGELWGGGTAGARARVARVRADSPCELDCSRGGMLALKLNKATRTLANARPTESHACRSQATLTAHVVQDSVQEQNSRLIRELEYMRCRGMVIAAAWGARDSGQPQDELHTRKASSLYAGGITKWPCSRVAFPPRTPRRMTGEEVGMEKATSSQRGARLWRKAAGPGWLEMK